MPELLFSLTSSNKNNLVACAISTTMSNHSSLTLTSMAEKGCYAAMQGNPWLIVLGIVIGILILVWWFFYWWPAKH